MVNAKKYGGTQPKKPNQTKIKSKKQSNDSKINKNKNKRKLVHAKNSKLIAQLDEQDVSSLIKQVTQESSSTNLKVQPTATVSSLKDIKQLNEKDIATTKQNQELAQRVDDDLLQQLKVMDDIKI